MTATESAPLRQSRLYQGEYFGVRRRWIYQAGGLDGGSCSGRKSGGGYRPPGDCLCGQRTRRPTSALLALVGRPPGASAETLGEEKDTASPTTALLAAVRYANAKGVTIGAQVSWSDDPAQDIITVAREARVAWILLGYHRAALESDTTGGVVREVLAKAKVLPINVGVFIQGTDRPIDRVFAAVDSTPDGRASLALGVRIAKGNRYKLRALLVAKRMPSAEDALLDTLQDVRADFGDGFHADVLTERSLRQLHKQAPGRLLIVGRKFADEVGLRLDEVPGSHRCVIVVQGCAS